LIALEKLNTTLFQLAERYLSTHALAKSGIVGIGVAIRSFGAYLGRPAAIDDLDHETVGGWLDSTAGRHTETTIRGYRQRIMTLWHFAAEEKLTAAPPASTLAPPPPRIEPIPDPRSPVARQLDSSIRDYVGQYRLEHDIKPQSASAMLAVVGKFERYLGRAATLADFTAPAVNGWLADLRDRVGIESVYGYRRTLLILWRAAHVDGLVGEFPSRVKRIKRPERVIDGWDATQMGKLLAACDTLRGAIRGLRIGTAEQWLASERRTWREESSRETRHGATVYMQIDRRAYFRALFSVLWDTGVRLGDVLRIEPAWIQRQSDGSGAFTLVQSKVGRRINRTLRPETMRDIDATLPPERKLLFPLWSHRENFYKTVRLIVKTAGLTGTMKFIRRGSASEVEKLAPGCGKLHLGHSPKSVGLFEQSYAVWRICGRTAPLPPAIVPIVTEGGA
jgi:integrase